ncbi:LAFA_0A01266g1_1 [Lachancea sp. 'fantastica']|nr:LAFA_0A01266g1_1 [Lachancea sp. 'fantastica']
MLTAAATQLPFFPPTHQRRRAQWSSREDLGLLQTVLKHKHLLTVTDIAEYPRSRKLFWHHVRAALLETHHVEMNRRQCRDRFRLLYQRSQSRAQYCTQLPPASRAEALGDECTRVFRFNENRELVIADLHASEMTQASSSSSPLQPFYSSTMTPIKEDTVPAPLSSSSSPVISSSTTLSSLEIQTICTAIAGLQHQLGQLSQQLDTLTQTVAQVAQMALCPRDEVVAERTAGQYVADQTRRSCTGMQVWPLDYQAPPAHEPPTFRYPQYAEN